MGLTTVYFSANRSALTLSGPENIELLFILLRLLGNGVNLGTENYYIKLFL